MRAVCEICPHHCSLEEGQTGSCHARRGDNGRVVSANYGKITSMALDPIEKKPLAMFHPGSRILSVGSFGCNLRCPFCQNSEISQAGESIENKFLSPQDLVAAALNLKQRNNIGVAFTYNEPLVGFEYVLDCSRLLHQAGLLSVIVTNGMICKEPMKELLPFVDAMNIDLKGFSQGFYDWCGGCLDTVKDTISMCCHSCHVEVTCLIIPGMNDSPEEMLALSKWLSSLDKGIVLHITRFFPSFHMLNHSPTDISLMHRLKEAAEKYLDNVFLGNVW
ncbi:MAG: AmmeMemoRadiSam system radical SAM enzyme [Sphaerochaetaceae bacterium]|jgi:pyruvate formate lyase activating enzyme|nr:AmmeMemoRadiSam system radical SAM enzyme [Sphaerochaetaceae bacterium]